MEPYCDALSYIYKLFNENPPASSAQLVMLHLLHENYCLGNTGTVHMSDRELGLRTRLSKQSITEAKRTLKNRGWIDFKTDRDKPHKATTYTILISEKVGQQVGQRVGQTLGQRVGHQSFIPYTQKAEIPTNSNSKGGHSNQSLLTPTTSNNSTISNNSNNQSIYLSSKFKNKNLIIEDRQTDRKINTNELKELIGYWEEELRGGQITISQQEELERLMKDKGIDWVKEAMNEASDTNNNPHGLQFKLLRGVIARKESPSTPKVKAKGGEKVGRGQIDTGSRNAEELDAAKYPWRN